jgi:hypothetical protein
MAGVKLAAVQAAYTLMNQEACVDKAVKLLHQAAAEGAGIVVFPEVFIPGNPIWIDTVPIWDGDGDWYALLVKQAVVVPGPITDTLRPLPAIPAPTWSSGRTNGNCTAPRSTTQPSISGPTAPCSASTAS